MKTWDSIEVENCETVFYCVQSSKPDTDKVIYLPVKGGLFDVGRKTLMALEWALQNKEFDFIARAHSSIYVDKKELRKYIDTLPETNVISGLQVLGEQSWLWGGCGFVLSKDVVQKIVANKDGWRHTEMEDRAISFLCSDLGIPFTQGMGCSIDKKDNDTWSCTSYGTPGFDFDDFSAMKKASQYYIRVKQDGHREIDEYLMNELFRVLN